MERVTKKIFKIFTPIFIVFIILIVVDICTRIDSFAINDYNKMLTFVGILASVIVIGNVAQIFSIKSDTEKEIEKLREQQKLLTEQHFAIMSRNELLEQKIEKYIENVFESYDKNKKNNN
ncbi:MAG: hypothetical protein LBV69_10395 [Bacteroidales bacterium]|jgi:hypothetical protein|nr:hypothetical protein [Bacteroidales bacterium]